LMHPKNPSDNPQTAPPTPSTYFLFSPPGPGFSPLTANVRPLWPVNKFPRIRADKGWRERKVCRFFSYRARGKPPFRRIYVSFFAMIRCALALHFSPRPHWISRCVFQTLYFQMPHSVHYRVSSITGKALKSFFFGETGLQICNFPLRSPGFYRKVRTPSNLLSRSSHSPISRIIVETVCPQLPLSQFFPIQNSVFASSFLIRGHSSLACQGSCILTTPLLVF